MSTETRCPPAPTFSPVETATVGDLKHDDFVIAILPFAGVRPATINSAVRDMRDDWDTWTRSSGYRRPRYAVKSRVLMFQDHKQAARNLPYDALVEVRRINL